MAADPVSAGSPSPGLARRLGLFDATMIVMGGIIGSGIFMNPYVVARQVHTPFLILGVWILGGWIGLSGAFIWAELAARRPQVGGQYAYLREAFHPLLAFLYGWVLLLVIQTGGMAAVAVTFARYFVELTGVPIAEGLLAACALGGLALINCLGVKAGSATQSTLMVLKILAILVLIACGLWFAGKPAGPQAFADRILDRPVSLDLLTAIGAAMVPVLFAYGGWQTSCFIAGEVREPHKNLPRGLIIGVAGVVALYLSVNYVCMRVLGTTGLAATTTPASDVMKAALGQTGARLMAAGIAISTLGFLSQSMLTAPRVYYAMAEDGLFFKSAGRPGTHAGAGGRHYSAGCVCRHHRALGTIRADPQLRRVHGFHFLWPERRQRLCLAPPGRGNRESSPRIPDSRPPGDDCLVRRHLLARGHQHHL